MLNDAIRARTWVCQLTMVLARTEIQLAVTSIHSFGDQLAFDSEVFNTFQLGLDTKQGRDEGVPRRRPSPMHLRICWSKT